MIESLLQRNLDGSWAVPNSSLIERIEGRVKICAEKCNSTSMRIALVGSERIGVQSFKGDLTKLGGRLKVLNDRVGQFRQIALEEIDRKALTALLMQLAVSVGELKNLHANPHLFDDGDRVYVDDLLEVLTQAVGEVPKGFYDTKTAEISKAVSLLPPFNACCELLTKFYNDQVFTHPTLALSFSSDDQEIATQISDLLKRAVKNVIIIEDFGPRASRSSGAFHKELKSADYILIIGSSSYGQKARSPAPSAVKSEADIIGERYSQRPDHIMTLIVEGSLDISLPLQMAHSSFGHLLATSAPQIIPALIEVLTRVYDGRNMDHALKELKGSILPLFDNPPSATKQKTQPSLSDPPLLEEVPVSPKTPTRSPNEQLEPLHAAARDGQKERVEELLKQGARVDSTDKLGSQPLHWAALNGHKEIVELLFSIGAPINAADMNGSQPLHWAASRGQEKVVELLLSKGALVNATDRSGRQPLHLAAMKGEIRIVGLLLKMGAEIDKVDSSGNRPLDWALFYEHNEVATLLHQDSTVEDETKQPNPERSTVAEQPNSPITSPSVTQKSQPPHASKNPEIEPLLKVYRSKGHLSRFINKEPFPIDKSFINLAIVERESYKDMDRGNRRLNRHLTLSSFFDKPLCVNLHQLFDGTKRVYVEGDAGSGKTTLCNYITYNWAILSPEERLQALGPWANQYEAVIWIPLREIQILPREASLFDLMHKLYPGLSISKLEPDSTLYILDSFDEIAPLEEVCKRSSEDKRWEIVNTLIDQPHWLMTSRPGLFHTRFSVCRRLTNLGFTESNIKSYIQRFAEDFKIPSDSLEKAVLKNSDLKALAQIPLYLELVCSLWKDNRTILDAVNSSAALYDAMAIYLFRRHIERLQTGSTPLLNSRVLNHKDVLLYRVSLEKIAFMSRHLGGSRITPAIYEPILDQDPFISYSDEELQLFGKRLFEDLGLLTPRGDSKQLFDQDYVFLHPTFEEYFAARHVVAELESSRKLASGQTASAWLESNYLLKEKESIIDFIASLAKTDAKLNALAEKLVGVHQADESTSSWQYPLHRAASLGLASLTQLLIRKGMKIDSRNNSGSHPLHTAAYNGQKEIIEILLKEGAEVKATMENGWQPLHLAALKGHKETIELLLNMGAKVDAVNVNGSQALHYAALQGHKEVVEFLLKLGAKVDAAKNDGRQSIHAAAQNGHVEVVELLLSKGAKVDSTCKAGKQPLHLASQNGNREVVELLLKKGAKVDAVDCEGKQPHEIASENGHEELLKLLTEKKTDTNKYIPRKRIPHDEMSEILKRRMKGGKSQRFDSGDAAEGMFEIRKG